MKYVEYISAISSSGKRYRYNAENLKSGPIPNRVGIEHRPAEAALKQEPGHFEIDTIFGKDQKSFLLTIVDNAFKKVIIRKLPISVRRLWLLLSWTLKPIPFASLRP